MRLVGAVLDPLAAASQPAAVQRVGLEPVRDEIRDDGREHQRQNERVVVRHLEHEQNPGDRRVRRRRDESAHADDRVRFGPNRSVRQQLRERNTEGASRGRADVQRRREEPARSAGVRV